MRRRTALSAIGAAAAGLLLPRPNTARAEPTPGVTAAEIKIGNTMPYSGPASSYGIIGRCDAAFFRMVNDQGGIAGRKITFITLDDAFSPPRTVEQTRKLVEQEEVAFLFNATGTACNTAVQKYLNDRKVPQLFVATGADKWGNYKANPWTIGFQPSYRTEAQIYAKYILATKPDAKIGVLYENDDFGKDYVLGIRDVLGDRFDRMVKTISYEVTDPTVDSQITSLQSGGADVLVIGAIAKFAAQAIRKVYDIGWKPLCFVSYVSSSVGMVMKPVGPEKAIGLLTGIWQKDPTDPGWNDDNGMKDWRAFMAKYLPDADVTDSNYVYAYGVSWTLLQALQRCAGDFSRHSVMRHATDLDLELPTLLPGMRLNTSPTNYHPIRQMQLGRFNGTTWERFGELIEGSGA
jgi:branched-chain amino acid transport system substrate-binding protein